MDKNEQKLQEIKTIITLRATHLCYFFVPNQVFITFAHLVVRCYNFVWLFPWLCGFERYIMVIRNIFVEKLQIDIFWRKIIKAWNSLKIRKKFQIFTFEKLREKIIKNLCWNKNWDCSTTTCRSNMIQRALDALRHVDDNTYL